MTGSFDEILDRAKAQPAPLLAEPEGVRTRGDRIRRTGQVAAATCTVLTAAFAAIVVVNQSRPATSPLLGNSLSPTAALSPSLSAAPVADVGDCTSIPAVVRSGQTKGAFVRSAQQRVEEVAPDGTVVASLPTRAADTVHFVAADGSVFISRQCGENELLLRWENGQATVVHRGDIGVPLRFARVASNGRTVAWVEPASDYTQGRALRVIEPGDTKPRTLTRDDVGGLAIGPDGRLALTMSVAAASGSGDVTGVVTVVDAGATSLDGARTWSAPDSCTAGSLNWRDAGLVVAVRCGDSSSAYFLDARLKTLRSTPIAVRGESIDYADADASGRLLVGRRDAAWRGTVVFNGTAETEVPQSRPCAGCPAYRYWWGVLG